MPQQVTSTFLVVSPTTRPEASETPGPILPTPSITTSIIKPTPSETAISFPTATPNTGLVQNCLDLSDTKPQDIDINGWIVLNGQTWGKPSYLMNLTTEETLKLPKNEGDAIEDMHVSPDGNWLVYKHEKINSGSSELVVIDNEGNPYQSFSWDISWRLVAGWLDNERIWISQEKSSDHDVLILLNPFTGEKQELATEFPGFINLYPDPGWGWFNWSTTIYNHDLSRAIYPSGINKLILWDIQNDYATAVITGTASLYNTPRWSSNEQVALITGSADLSTKPSGLESSLDREELYSINLEGKVIRLTHLTDYFSEVDFGEYAWSPNGRYVAFNLQVEPNTYPDIYPSEKKILSRLALFDTFTQSITDFCVPNKDLGVPVWSPTSEQLLIENFGPGANENEIYLIDLTQSIAIKVLEDISVVGWMIEAP
ncbi:MAG: hypothetical protein Fur0022_09190 [Anaerolineales bacterium]